MDLASKENLDNRLDVVLAHHNAIRKGLNKEIFSKDKLMEDLIKIAPEILKFSKPVWKMIDNFKKEKFLHIANMNKQPPQNKTKTT